jgi:hypothetical protein
MGANNRAVQNDVFQVWVLSKMLMHILPNAMITPAGKSLVNAIPGAIFVGQEAPLRTSAHDPVNCINKKAAIRFVANISPRMCTQKRAYFDPLRI